MSKIVITDSEVRSVVVPVDAVTPGKLPRAIPIWARLVMLPLVLALPVLAIAALVMRIGLRAAAPRTQQAWHSYLMALLIAGSFVFTTSAILVYSYLPSPPQVFSSGLPDLDARESFPVLPTERALSGVEVAQQLKPLVLVATPAVKLWFSRGEMATRYVGAAVLLQATSGGYLFATARHVVEAASARSKRDRRVLLTASTGGLGAADVVAVHQRADLALLWIPRRQGSGDFVQPLTPDSGVQEGSNVFVIGHPEGLNFTISSGMISRLAGDLVQISAPVSPGNSGGPVYDEHGNLLAIVVAKLDRTIDPNAENLNFAASSSLLRQMNGWEFAGEGHELLSRFIAQLDQKQRSRTTTDRK